MSVYMYIYICIYTSIKVKSLHGRLLYAHAAHLYIPYIYLHTWVYF